MGVGNRNAMKLWQLVDQYWEKRYVHQLHQTMNPKSKHVVFPILKEIEEQGLDWSRFVHQKFQNKLKSRMSRESKILINFMVFCKNEWFIITLLL